MHFNGRHVLQIRCAYTCPTLSRLRLDITRATLAPSLAAQTCRDSQLLLLTNPADPLLPQRLQLFADTGLQLIDALPDTPGLTLQTRVDDDDGLAVDFVAAVQHEARTIARPAWLVFPRGIVFAGGSWYRMHHPRNMFPSLLMERPPSIFVRKHAHLHGLARRHEIRQPGRFWVWIRHAATKSRRFAAGTERATPAEIARFAHVDFAAVMRLHRLADRRLPPN